MKQGSAGHHRRSDLVRIATQAMHERQLLTEFGAQVEAELEGLRAPDLDVAHDVQGVHDLRDLPWCSIDNDDSRDLDQLSCIEALENGATRLRVAIADVDALVGKDSAIDKHAQANGATVYTSARIFPMLPELLSYDLTSLNPGADRFSLVTEMEFSADAELLRHTIYRAKVHNQCKLAYDAVALWLDGAGPLPAPAQAVPDMDWQLRQQDALAQQLRVARHAKGSLEFETFQPQAVFQGDKVVAIIQQVHNRARQLIEEVMVVTNQCNARFLARSGSASLRRVVRSPDRWLRIVAVAQQYGEALPPEPDALALEAFLARRRQADPLRFADLSLIIVKLMGSGEYVLESSHGVPTGHFALAVRDYTHSTAPNRRYPDLITSRLLKAAIAGQPSPYSERELAQLAIHCTHQEDAVRKVERRMRKSDAAMYLESRMGREFSALVTGNSDGGIWVRLIPIPIEGKLLADSAPEVGAQLRVRLVSTSVEHGFIDFVPAR